MKGRAWRIQGWDLIQALKRRRKREAEPEPKPHPYLCVSGHVTLCPLPPGEFRSECQHVLSDSECRRIDAAYCRESDGDWHCNQASARSSWVFAIEDLMSQRANLIARAEDYKIHFGNPHPNGERMGLMLKD